MIRAKPTESEPCGDVSAAPVRGTSRVLIGIRRDGQCPIKLMRLRCKDGDRHSAVIGCGAVNGRSAKPAVQSGLVNWRSRPILLKNSIRVFPASILGVSNHHPINLRGSERDLEGRLFRGHATPPLHVSFSTLLANRRRSASLASLAGSGHSCRTVPTEPDATDNKPDGAGLVFARIRYCLRREKQRPARQC